MHLEIILPYHGILVHTAILIKLPQTMFSRCVVSSGRLARPSVAGLRRVPLAALSTSGLKSEYEFIKAEVEYLLSSFQESKIAYCRIC
jgi:hypothetical protein